MAHFNQCSQLIKDVDVATTMYHNHLDSGLDPLQTMMNMQHSLQVKLAQEKPKYNQHPDNLDTAGKVLDWLRAQDDSIADETRELYTALGGMSNGEKAASAVWKPWKSDHEKMRNTPISELSPEDQLEIKFELIDQLHFFLNKFMALGMSSKEVFELYYLKNKENFARQERNY